MEEKLNEYYRKIYEACKEGLPEEWQEIKMWAERELFENSPNDKWYGDVIVSFKDMQGNWHRCLDIRDEYSPEADSIFYDSEFYYIPGYIFDLFKENGKEPFMVFTYEADAQGHFQSNFQYEYSPQGEDIFERRTLWEYEATGYTGNQSDKDLIKRYHPDFDENKEGLWDLEDAKARFKPHMESAKLKQFAPIDWMNGKMVYAQYTGTHPLINLIDCVEGKSMYEIAPDTFAGHTELRQILLATDLLTIGDRAFKGCTSLERIEIPRLVTHIGSEAFAGCTSMKKIVIPQSVTDIAEDAFADIADLTILAPPGSYAHSYAERHSIPVEDVEVSYRGKTIFLTKLQDGSKYVREFGSTFSGWRQPY